MRNSRNFIISLLVLCTCACSGGKSSQEYHEALMIHEEIVSVEAETRSIFDSLNQVLARDSTLLAYREEVEALSREMEEWERNVVAVGSEADHDGHHHHQHAGRPDLTDQQMLEVQKELRLQLQSISDRVSDLVERMMDR